jgi:hypothetical protein
MPGTRPGMTMLGWVLPQTICLLSRAHTLAMAHLTNPISARGIILGGLGLAALGAKVDDAAAKPTLDKFGPQK